MLQDLYVDIICDDRYLLMFSEHIYVDDDCLFFCE